MDTWFEAIRRGDAQFVRCRMAEFARTINSNGFSGLMIAAYLGHQDIVELLCDAEHGMSDPYGDYATYYALRNGNIRALDYLLPFESNERVLRDIAETASKQRIVVYQTRYGEYKQSIYKLQLLLDSRMRLYSSAQQKQEADKQYNGATDEITRKLIKEKDMLNQKITELYRFIAEQNYTIDEEQSSQKQLYAEIRRLNQELASKAASISELEKHFLTEYEGEAAKIKALESENEQLRMTSRQDSYESDGNASLRKIIVNLEKEKNALELQNAVQLQRSEKLEAELLAMKAQLAQQKMLVATSTYVHRYLLQLYIEETAREQNRVARICNTATEDLALLSTAYESTDATHSDLYKKNGETRSIIILLAMNAAFLLMVFVCIYYFFIY